MADRKTELATLVLTLLVVSAAPALGCIAHFGYTGGTADRISAISASVPVSTSLFGTADPAKYIVDDVEFIKARSGPVVIDLTQIIFNPNTVSGIDCRHYERGGASVSKANYHIRGAYQSRLDTFFSVNSALFRGDVDVIALVLHGEANNDCVEAWKLNLAADYVKQKLTQPGFYLPRIVAGYGLRNTINGPASHGFPINPDGTIAQFPNQLTSVAYWVYDIFDPNNSSHPNNINHESWTQINAKLNQALRPGQKTLGVFKAFCWPNGVEETRWGIGCPGQAVWKLGVVALNWRNFWLNDNRNEAVVAFHWPDNFNPNGTIQFYGTTSLSPIWDEHASINASRNCSMTFPFF